MRQSRELAKLLAAAFGAFGGEREDVLESDPPVGPDSVVRDPALLEQLHEMRARDVQQVGGLFVVSSLPYGISESAKPADMPSATSFNARKSSQRHIDLLAGRTDESRPLSLGYDRRVELTRELAQVFQLSPPLRSRRHLQARPGSGNPWSTGPPQSLPVRWGSDIERLEGFVPRQACGDRRRGRF